MLRRCTSFQISFLEEHVHEVVVRKRLEVLDHVQVARSLKEDHAGDSLGTVRSLPVRVACIATPFVPRDDTLQDCAPFARSLLDNAVD